MGDGLTQLVSAAGLEQQGILKKGTAYKMLKAGLLVGYRVGVTGRGVRFRVDEVLASLKSPQQAVKP